MATHSSTVAWRIPWTEEPGRLQSMGSLEVGHDWVTSLSLFTFMHWRRKWQPTLPGASVRNSAHGKGHEEGGLAGAKAWSSLRKPPVPEHLPPKPESAYFTVSCSRLHLWLYGGLFPTGSLGEGVNVQLQLKFLGVTRVFQLTSEGSLEPAWAGSAGHMWLFTASQPWEARDALKLSKCRLFWEIRKLLV